MRIEEARAFVVSCASDERVVEAWNEHNRRNFSAKMGGFAGRGKYAHLAEVGQCYKVRGSIIQREVLESKNHRRGSVDGLRSGFLLTQEEEIAYPFKQHFKKCHLNRN